MATTTIEEKLLDKQNSRNIIRAKLVELGLATSSAKLDALARAIEGIVNRGAVQIEVREGETVSVPAGFHNGSGTISGVAGGGNYKLQSKGPITPTKNQQPITPDNGYYGLSDVMIGAIPEAYQDVSGVTASAADTLAGKIIVLADGTIVAGTMPDNGAVNKTLDATTVSYTIPAGKHSGTGVVKITLEEKNGIVPTKASQTITPTAGKVMSKVVIEAIPEKFVDNSGVTASDADVLDGKPYGAPGEVRTGSMPNNGAVSGTVNGITTLSVDVPAGYTSGGTVSFDDTKIVEMLDAI